MRFLVGVVVLVGFGVAVKPAYRAYREYRIDRNLAAAQAAARTEHWEQARDKALSVLLGRRDSFEAFRIWGRALGKLSDPRAFIVATEIFSDPRASREDRLEFLRMLAAEGPHALALRAFGSLPEALHKDAAFRAAISPLLVQRGEADFAERNLRHVMRPTDKPAVRLELVRILCRRPDVWRMAEARRIFADFIAAKADTEALAALVLLGDIPQALTPGTVLPDLQVWLKTQPQATAIHHLAAMNQAIEMNPESAARLYDSAIKRFLTTEPVVLGTWLVRHNQGERAAALLAEPAKTQADVFLCRVQILLRLRRDKAVEEALTAPPPAADLVDLEIAQAMLAWQRDKPNLAEAALNRALNRAAFDPKRNRFIEIALVAQSHGASAVALDAWVGAVRLGWGTIPLYHDLRGMVGALAAKSRTEDLLAMCRTMLRFEPQEPDLLNNYYYLALIHNILPPDRVVSAQKELIAYCPGRPEFNSTLMLAEMLAGRPAEALAGLPRLRDCKQVDPMMKTALEGSARVLAGETEAGTALLRQVEWTGFLRQERAVFRDMLVKLKASAVPVPDLKAETVEAAPDQIPAWRKAVERLEKDRASDVLPALPTAPHFKNESLEAAPEQTPAWRKALQRHDKDQSPESLPALPPPRSHRSGAPAPAAPQS